MEEIHTNQVVEVLPYQYEPEPNTNVSSGEDSDSECFVPVLINFLQRSYVLKLLQEEKQSIVIIRVLLPK